MKTNTHKINLLNAVVGALIFMVLPIGIQYWYNKAMPRDAVFTYYEVRPVFDEYLVDTKPRMYSDAEFKKAVPIKWVDILRCTVGEDRGTFAFFSVYPSETGQVKISERVSFEDSGGWKYQGETPREPRTCYIESTITAELEYGIKKTQQLESPTFNFVHEI